jgi:hypothetical protein
VWRPGDDVDNDGEQSTNIARGPSGDSSDLVWGAENIGRVIGRTKSQVYGLIRVGALVDFFVRVVHRTIMASRRRLLNWRRIRPLSSRKAETSER